MTIKDLIAKLDQLPHDWYVRMHPKQDSLAFGNGHAPLYVHLTGTLTGDPEFTIYTSHDDQPVPNQWLRDQNPTP